MADPVPLELKLQFILPHTRLCPSSEIIVSLNDPLFSPKSPVSAFPACVNKAGHMVSAQLFLILIGVDSGEDVLCRISSSEATANWTTRRSSGMSEAQPATDMSHILHDEDDGLEMRISPLGVLSVIYRGLKDSDAEEG